MANTYDLLLAIMEIARADTGTGGLAGVAGLTGKDVPIVRWEDLVTLEDPDRQLPIATALVVSATPYAGLPPMLEAIVQFDGWVLGGSEGLESQIIDRIETVMTSVNFAAEGLDVAPTSGVRRTLTGEDFGRRRESMDMTLLLKV
ncbi:MAG: hypothetical protein AMJ65_06885 [Phycisphaerae bacterium SG8_4]|nr:MAG: hypothetical protein AMJ65_06885 [Phycisphaerae bacterium SG8_4]